MKRVTNKQLAEAVKRGARYLDKHHAGWAEKLDLKTLRLQDTNQCVLGQCFGEFWEALAQILNLNSGDEALCSARADTWAIHHGFNVPPNSSGCFERLGLLWAPEIAVRQMQARLDREFR